MIEEHASKNSLGNGGEIRLSSKLDALVDDIQNRTPRAIARAITLLENHPLEGALLLEKLEALQIPEAMTLGITGTGGAGKSTLVSGLVGILREQGHRVGVIAVDPSSPLSGGAVLGDRIRMMRHSVDQDVIIRSMASRNHAGGISSATAGAALVLKAAGCNPVIIETMGVGQAELGIIRMADITALVLAPGLGDDIQAMKSGLVELVDVLVVNKGDLPGADALMGHMTPVATQSGREIVRVSAKSGIGMKALLACVKRTFVKSMFEGKVATRRREAREVQAQDIALTMVQFLIQQALEQQDEEMKNCSPRHRAIQAVAALFDGKPVASSRAERIFTDKKIPDS